MALAGRIDGTPWELRVDNGSSTSVLIDGRAVAWGSQPGYTSLNAVGVGECVIVFGLAPADPDGVGLFPDARAVTCTVRRTGEAPATFEADPDAVTTAQIGELVIEVDLRSGTAGSVNCSVMPVGLRDLAGGWAYQASVGSTLTASQRGDARMVAMRVGVPAT